MPYFIEMEEDFDPLEFEENEDSNTQALLEKFEEMARGEVQYFFDADEFEDIIDFYLFKNNFSQSEIAIQFASEQHPTNVIFKLKKAQLLASSDNTEKALRILSDIEQNYTADGDVFLTKGAIYSQLKRYEKAIEEYKKALNLTEELDEVYGNIAFEYENLGKYEKALEYLQKALEINPENSSFLYEISFCYEISNRNEESITFFNQFINKYPYSHHAWFNLGLAYGNLEQLDKAIEAYDYSIAIDPTFASAYFNKANAFANTNQFDQAIEVYRETFLYEPPEALTYYYIGECYEKQKKFESAKINFSKSLEIDDNFADAHIGLGIAEDELGSFEEALKHITRATKMDPDNSEYWFILGDLQFKHLMYADALISYEKVTELDYLDPEIWLEYSEVYCEIGNIDAALSTIRNGMNLQPDNIQFQYRNAAYLYLAGNTDAFYMEVENLLKTHSEDIEKLTDFVPELLKEPLFSSLLAKYSL